MHCWQAVRTCLVKLGADAQHAAPARESSLSTHKHGAMATQIILAIVLASGVSAVWHAGVVPLWA